MTSAAEPWIARLGQRLTLALETAEPLPALAAGLGRAVHWPTCPRATDCWSTGDGYRRLAAGEVPGLWWAALIAWPPGHATPIHDHGGLWGVEVVLDGILELEAFALDGLEPVPDRAGSRVLGHGDAGMFEGPGYAHRCRNLSTRQPALSLHVYGAELACYRAFQRAESGAWAGVECHVGCERAGA